MYPRRFKHTYLCHAPLHISMQLEGAVIDFHMDGHREAFNRAFRSLGVSPLVVLQQEMRHKSL